MSCVWSIDLLIPSRDGRHGELKLHSRQGEDQQTGLGVESIQSIPVIMEGDEGENRPGANPASSTTRIPTSGGVGAGIS